MPQGSCHLSLPPSNQRMPPTHTLKNCTQTLYSTETLKNIILLFLQSFVGLWLLEQCLDILVNGSIFGWRQQFCRRRNVVYKSQLISQQRLL